MSRACCRTHTDRVQQGHARHLRGGWCLLLMRRPVKGRVRGLRTVLKSNLQTSSVMPVGIREVLGEVTSSNLMSVAQPQLSS